MQCALLSIENARPRAKPPTFPSIDRCQLRGGGMSELEGAYDRAAVEG